MWTGRTAGRIIKTLQLHKKNQKKNHKAQVLTKGQGDAMTANGEARYSHLTLWRTDRSLVLLIKQPQGHFVVDARPTTCHHFYEYS